MRERRAEGVLPRTLARLKSGIAVVRRGAVTDALFFDEIAYRVENEDVAVCLDAGKVESAYDHYVRYGKWEGRRFALRRWGLSDRATARLYAVAAGLEVKLDVALCAATWGEVAHRLRNDRGDLLVKPLGPWKHQLDVGPWRAPLPRAAEKGGYFMLTARVAPVRAPLAFHACGADGEPLSEPAAMFCKPARATRRLVWLPPGSTELEITLLDQRLRTQPLRVRLRRVPDRLVEGRMLRRLVHHHRRFLMLPAKRVKAILKRDATEDGRPLSEAMWDAYVSTFPAPSVRGGYAEWISAIERPHTDVLDREAPRRVESLRVRPRISVLVPACDPSEVHLRRCLESVLEQSYPHWELCVVDDASRGAHVRRVLEELAARDERVKVRFRTENGHICRASNDALEMATGEYVALLDHDDALPRHALLLVAEAVDANPDAVVLYGDEDKISEGEAREQPHFKPDFDPNLLLAQNYMGHLVTARACEVREVGGFRPGYEGSQDHDLVLRLTETLRPEQVVHIPHVLYHWRMGSESTAASPDAKPYTVTSGLAAVRDALARRGEDGSVVETEVANCYRVARALARPEPAVSVIVPTRDAPELLAKCIDSLINRTQYGAFEVIIVDNGTKDPAALRVLDRVSRDERVRVIRDERPFNFSALNNLAARQAEGRVLTLLNNDIEVTDGEWLRELVSHAVHPEIGCVGAKLLFPDGTIQHAGVVVGLHGLAGHPYRHMSARHPGYYGRLCAPHAVSAVTAACLVVRRDIYEALGGFDEELAVAFNDVDFCLRVKDAGYRNLMVPHVTLVHHESASRGLDQDPEKRRRFLSEVTRVKRRWGPRLYEDSCYSPHLSLDHEDYSLRITR